MADIKLNFTSQWPTIHVAKVIYEPSFNTAYAHGLPYPPMAIAFGKNAAEQSYNQMVGIDVDSTNIYIPNTPYYPAIDCVVIYAVDITKPFNYSNLVSAIGEVPYTYDKDIDMRKFLLHSRCVGPMVLNISTKDLTSSADTLSYTSTLSYPTFSFGWLRVAQTVNTIITAGRWINVPLAGQAWPVMRTDGYTSLLTNASYNGSQIMDKATILTIRNPAVITNNTVNITI